MSFAKDSQSTVTSLAPTSPLPQDYDSQSSPRPRNTSGVEMRAQHDHPPPPIENNIPDIWKKSKLSELAHSRSTPHSTKSSQALSLRSFATDSASVLTYSTLRPSYPSSSSEFAPSEASSEEPSEILTAISSHIQRVVDTATGQERLEELLVKSEVNPEQTSSESTGDPHTASPKQGARGLSKLALLAQAKAKQNNGTTVSWVRPPSATVRPSRLQETREHNTRTKLVTPVGNGPTVTTAITTSYQSLGNLMAGSTFGLSPSFSPTDEPQSTPSPAYTTSTQSLQKPTSSQKPPVNKSVSSPKLSKLAMKVKQTQQQVMIPEAEDLRDPIKPIFLPTAGPNAKPSPFASVLLDEDEPRGKSRWKKDSTSESRRGIGETPLIKTVNHTRNPPAFAFDVPSPDDIIFNARRGTSLAQQVDARIKQGPPATSRSPSHPKRVSSRM